MSKKVKIPTFKDVDEDNFIEQLEKLGECCRAVKVHFPKVWTLLKNQYKLECFPKVLSKKVFRNLLQATIEADDELRNND